MVGFIFGGDTGETAESLERKRRIAEALMRRAAGSQPANIPEGILAVADAIAGRMGMNALDKQEAEGQAAFGDSLTDYARRYGGSSSTPDLSGFSGSDYTANGEGGDYFSSIRSAESGGNDSAKNPNSTATGRYQFTTGTWADVAKAHPELGLTADGRLDPAQQEKAIRAFTADNAKILAGAGIEATGGNLYAAHFLGAGGARNVLSQPDNASVASIVGPDVVRANSFLSGMSVGDFKRWAASKGGSGGVNVLEGGEGDDQFNDAITEQGLPLDSPGVEALRRLKQGQEVDPIQTAGLIVGSPTSRLRGSGINTATGGPASPPPSPAGPVPAGREYFAGTPLPQMPPQMAPTPAAAPVPTARPAMAAPPPPAAVDPMQTAAIPRPRVGQSQHADSAGYGYAQNASPGVRRVTDAVRRRVEAAGASAASSSTGDPVADGYSLLSNPYATPGQIAVLQAIIKRKIEEGDPAFQLDMDLKRAQVAKAQREAASDGSEVKVVGDRAVRIWPDGRTEDVTPSDGASTSDFRFSGTSVEAQALNGLMDSGKLTPEQAQQLAAGKTVSGPNGELLFLTPQGVFGQDAGGGQPKPVDTASPAAPAAPAAPPAGTPAPPAPSGRPGMIQLTDPKPTKATEQQRNRLTQVNQAYTAIGAELDRYADLVGQTGIEAMPGEAKDNLNAVRQGVMLQLKELFNLGVLNGPDLSLMERMIFDPTVDVTKEGGLTNLPDQAWTAMTGGAGARAKNSVTELKRMLDNIKSSVEVSVDGEILRRAPPAGDEEDIDSLLDKYR